MNEEFDINATAAAFLQQNIETFVDLGRGILKTAANKMHLHLTQTYQSYLTCVLEKYSTAKSFFIRGEPVNLYQFYVPLAVRSRKGLIERPGIADIKLVSRCSTIIGSAGSGKSIFMRHLLLNSVLTKSKVPIFIELRQFNNNGNDIIELIKQTLAVNKFHLEWDYIEKAIKTGHFIFFLDGFDEIIQSKRERVSLNIQDFVKKYDKNTIIMSSRPDNELEGWADFTILHLQPLTLDLAQELVQKLPYDEELKGKFLKDLRSGLFKQHTSFLSNPLLLSIMLLTYGQSAHIPNKLNVFYNQAYEALFERHDALKGGYRRQRLTNLDIQDFAKVFSCFCLQTYDRRQFEFTHVEALEYIEKSKAIAGIEFDKEDYLKDLLQSVCLLVLDGLNMVFSHRSFQEYFTARFIAEARPGIQCELLRKYSKNLRSDSIISLLYEMRPEIVEDNYISPVLDELFQVIKLKHKIGLSHYLRYVKEAYSSFRFAENTFMGADNTESQYHFSAITSFSLDKCIYLIGSTKLDKATDGFKYLKETYGKKGEKALIKTSGLTMRDPFVKDLATKGHYFSIRTLNLLLQIRNALKDKARRTEASLEDILNKKKGDKKVSV